MTPERLAEIEEDWCTFADMVELIAAYRAAQQSSHKLREELEAEQSRNLLVLNNISLCLNDKCQQHCGYKHLLGCDAVKAYLGWRDE